MTYTEAVAYIRSLSITGWRLGNARMEAFLQRLGNPHNQVPIVHVTGTNGKGSTTTLISSILRQAGYRVGSYISPHVFDLCERIQIDGEPISHDLLVEGVEFCKPHIERLRDTEYGQVTEFELKTALAFWAYATQRVDIVVLEVGLGGRIDATNVIVPEVSVIVSIGLDHTDRLGPTHRDIAYEKAGIIKPGRPVVSGALHPDADAMIAQVAQAQRAPLLRVRPACKEVALDGADLTLPAPLSYEERGEAVGSPSPFSGEKGQGVEGSENLIPPSPLSYEERGEAVGSPSPFSGEKGQGVEGSENLIPPSPLSYEERGEAVGSPSPFSGEKGQGVEGSENLTPLSPLSASREGGEPISPSPFTERGQGGEVNNPALGEGLGVRAITEGTVNSPTLLYEPLPSPRDSAVRVALGDWSMTLEPFLLGNYQRHNTACAVGAVLCLRERGFKISDEAIVWGVASARLPGRLQVVRERPTVVLDGAHNPDASFALAKSIPALFQYRRLLLVFGMLHPHEPAPVLEPLLNRASEVIFTRIPNERAYQPDVLMQIARTLHPELPMRVCETPSVAFATALESANPDDLVLITGSFYLIGLWRV